MTIVHEPGSVRQIHYFRAKVDGRYPVTYWGSLEEQIAEATRENARAASRHDHKTITLYSLAEDCEHENPEEAARFDGIDDLVDAWMERNTPGLTWRDGPLYYKNRRRAEASIPLYAEWRAADTAYFADHGLVCLLSPTGDVACTGCEGEHEDSYEGGGCGLAERVRETYEDFWWRVSPDGREDRARQDAES